MKKIKVIKKETLIMGILLAFILGTSFCFAAGGTVFTAIGTAIEETRGEIVKWSTGLAIIGIGFGVFTKKLANGDPEKIKKGDTAIKSTIVGWVVLNGAPLIFNTVQQWIK